MTMTQCLLGGFITVLMINGPIVSGVAYRATCVALRHVGELLLLDTSHWPGR